MAFDNYFYNQTIKLHIVNFGKFFSDIKIQRTDKDGDVLKTILVPITFIPKEKWLIRVEKSDANINRDDNDPSPTTQMILPRLAYDLIDFHYDAGRKLNGLNKFCGPVSNGVQSYQNGRAPYNFVFELYITTKNLDDGYQIIEQILPYFQPAAITKVYDNPVLQPDNASDIPIVLDGVTDGKIFEDAGNWDRRRFLMWTLRFTVKGWMYGPVHEGSIIKNVTTDVSDLNNCSLLESINVKIDPFEAEWDDDYEIITTITPENR